MRIVSLLLACSIAIAQERVNPDALIVQEFQRRVAVYLQVRKDLESQLKPLKPGDHPHVIAHHRHELAERVRVARKNAQRGVMFTPEIEKEFLRLMGLAMNGENRKKIHQSLKHAEPVNLKLGVNDKYPSHMPRQSMPPTLLLNLPELTDGLEYTVVSGRLLIIDLKTGLVVDFMSEPIP